MSEKIKISDPQAMIDWGAEFSQCLRPSMVVSLVGNLGAGKTHLCKGICQNLCSQSNVISPTFSIINQYPISNFQFFEPNSYVSHFDFYRLENESQLASIGWEELFYSQGLCILEWGNKFPSLYEGLEPGKLITLEIIAVNENQRMIELNSQSCFKA